MGDLSDLLARVESATGPDRDLDAAIMVAVLRTTSTEDDLIYHYVPHKSDQCAPGTYWRKSRSGASLRTAPEITASLDAALTLVKEKLPGWNWLLTCDDDDSSYAAGIGNGRRELAARAPTAALAILSALLRALQSEGGES